MRMYTKKRRVKPFRILFLIVLAAALVAALLLGLHACDSTGPSSSGAGGSAKTATSGTVRGSDTTASADTQTQTQAPTQTARPPYSEPYVQPAGAAWNLRLVNRWNAIEGDNEENLSSHYGSGCRVDKRMLEDLKAMVAAGNAANSAHNIRVTSGYRTNEFQAYLFNKNVTKEMKKDSSLTREQAEAIVVLYSSRAGTSEHQLGLAVDLLFANYSDLQEAYENTEAYAWMQAHCAEYGFILRYPKDKIDVTGIMFEPWHYRYVGREAAAEIMARGLTLEEYLYEKGL